MFWFIDNQFNDYWFQNLHATDIETIARQHVFINAYLHLELTSRLSLIHIKHCSDAKNIQTLSCVLVSVLVSRALCLRTLSCVLCLRTLSRALGLRTGIMRLMSPYWSHAPYVSVLVRERELSSSLQRDPVIQWINYGDRKSSRYSYYTNRCYPRSHRVY